MTKSHLKIPYRTEKNRIEDEMEVRQKNYTVTEKTWNVKREL